MNGLNHDELISETEKTLLRDTDDILPDLGDEEEFNSNVMDVDDGGVGGGGGGGADDGGVDDGIVDDGGVMVKKEVVLEELEKKKELTEGKHKEVTAIFVSDAGNDMLKMENQNNDDENDFHHEDGSDLRMDDILLIKRRRVRRPKQSAKPSTQAPEGSRVKSTSRSSSSPVRHDDLEPMEEPEEFSSPPKYHLPWITTLKTTLPSSLSSRTDRKRGKGQQQQQKQQQQQQLPEQQQQQQQQQQLHQPRPFPIIVSSLFAAFTESSGGIRDPSFTTVPSTGPLLPTASSTASSPSSSAPSSVTPSLPPPPPSPLALTTASNMSWKEMVNGIESLFVATTPTSFPPPTLLRGFAASLASLDVSRSLEESEDDLSSLSSSSSSSAASSGNPIPLSSSRPGDDGMMPVIDLGMRYFKQLTRLLPPALTSLHSNHPSNGVENRGDGIHSNRGEFSSPQDVYITLLPGFAGLQAKTKPSSRSQGERRNRLLAWLVPQSQDEAGDR